MLNLSGGSRILWGQDTVVVSVIDRCGRAISLTHLRRLIISLTWVIPGLISANILCGVR